MLDMSIVSKFKLEDNLKEDEWSSSSEEDSEEQQKKEEEIKAGVQVWNHTPF